MTTFLKPLKGSEEKKYLEEWAEGSKEAREKLILHNMRLVAHVVKKYAQSEADAEDLISIGTIGLIKAVDSFDVKRASRLGTYAAKCIDNAILSQMRLWFQINPPKAEKNQSGVFWHRFPRMFTSFVLLWMAM